MKNNTLNHNEKSKPQKMKDTEEERLKEIEKCYSNILTQIGEDPNREGLQKTPERAAKALQYFCKGYEASVEQEINGAIFDEQHKEMVIVKDIEIFSLCEHHLVSRNFLVNFDQFCINQS